jgi:hypothetical protein
MSGGENENDVAPRAQSLRLVLRKPGVAPLLASEIVSGLGSMMTSLALPWFVLETTGSVTRMSAVLIAETLPIVILGVPSGKVAARLGARRTLLVTQLAAAPLIGAIPLLHYIGWLTLPILLILVFLSGTLWTPFYAAQTSIIPDLVGEDERSVGSANALLQGASRTTYWLGPLAAGFSIALFSASVVLIIDAASFVLGYLLLLRVPRLEVPASAADEETGDVLGGVRFIVAHRIVSAIILAQALSQASYQALMLAIPVLAFVQFRSALVGGLLVGCWGAGALVGSVIAVPLTIRLPAIRVAPAAWVWQSASLWLLILPIPIGVLAAALVATGVGNGIRNPPTIAILVGRVPSSVRLQVFAATSVVVMLAGIAALLGTAPALQHIGLRATFAIVAGLSSVGAICFCWSILTEANPPGATSTPADMDGPV